VVPAVVGTNRSFRPKTTPYPALPGADPDDRLVFPTKRKITLARK